LAHERKKGGKGSNLGIGRHYLSPALSEKRENRFFYHAAGREKEEFNADLVSRREKREGGSRNRRKASAGKKDRASSCITKKGERGTLFRSSACQGGESHRWFPIGPKEEGAEVFKIVREEKGTSIIQVDRKEAEKVASEMPIISRKKGPSSQ